MTADFYIFTMRFEVNHNDFLLAVNRDTNSFFRFNEIKQKIEEQGYLMSVFNILLDVFNLEFNYQTNSRLTRTSQPHFLQNEPRFD